MHMHITLEEKKSTKQRREGKRALLSWYGQVSRDLQHPATALCTTYGVSKRSPPVEQRANLKNKIDARPLLGAQQDELLQI